jgi:hypothetical protein
MTDTELINNLKRIKKDFIRDKKELDRKYFELTSEANKKYLNSNPEYYKEGDIILLNVNGQNEFYKVVEIKPVLYYLKDIEYFEFFFMQDNLEEKEVYICYLCQKLQKKGTIGKTYYNIFDSHNNHIKIGESKDYDTPSKIRNLFGMQFDHVLHL